MLALARGRGRGDCNSAIELLAWLDKVRISVFKDAGLSVSFLFSCKRLQEKTMRQPRVALGTREEVIIPNAVA
jgi:hypothetical protein